MIQDDQQLEFQTLIRAIGDAAGFDPSESLTLPFDSMRSFLRGEGDYAALEHLRPKAEGKLDWAERFYKVAFNDVIRGFQGADYHVQNLERMLGAIRKAVQESSYRLGSGRTLCPSERDTRAIHYEYQACISAQRRALNYFGSSVAALYKREVKSIKDVRKILEEAEVRTALLQAWDEALEELSPLLSRGDRKSVRDRLEHREWVAAGMLNLHEQPHLLAGLAGGGEGLTAQAGGTRLDVLMRKRLKAIVDLVFRTYGALGVAPPMTAVTRT